MFSRQKSPVKKKFAKVVATKKHRRQLDPRTVVMIKQGVLGLLLLLSVGIIGTALWYGTRVEMLTLQTVKVAGGETINHDVIKAAVNETLEGDYIGLVPRRFAWWYPQEEIEQRVARIPRVKDPVVERSGGTELEITFSEYIPHALWCMGRGSDECYFIDEQGYAFTKAPKLTGGAFPRFHTIGAEPTEYSQMIPTSDLRDIEALRSRISNELALPIAYVETDMVRDVFLGVAGGGEIKATLRMSPEETFENLRTILSASEFSDIAPGSFQYIDLRFGSKVFVNEELESDLASSTVGVDGEGVTPEPWSIEPSATETDMVSNELSGDTTLTETQE